MNKAKTGMIMALAIFLFLSSGYGQELSDREHKIYYDAACPASVVMPLL